MKILILEDDEFISNQIKTYFELNEHSVEVYNNGETLLNSAILSSFDIFLFDINTPKINGIDTLKIIRDDNINTPAIFLTALSDISDMKLAYNVGCNDYIKKPFNLEEVELRINQLIHKNNIKLIKIYENYTFDVKNMNLKYQKNEVNLNHKEKALIYILVKNIPNVVESDQIINYVWDNKFICNNTLRTHIKKIRLKLKDNFIENIKNVGYKIKSND
jgi:DNA-binding response OmpR family regulator